MSHDHDHCNHVLNERLQRAAMEGCEESRLLMSRRAMLGVTASLFSWACMPRWAEAATDDPRLLVVVLRGGMDGVNVCIPYGDNNNYFSMRGSLAIPKASSITLNSYFGLHPALTRFGAMYRAKEAAIVHACATPLQNRSHFDCQDNLENGLPGFGVADATGWLNRLLTALPAGNPVKLKGAIEIGEAPLILRGPAPVLGWSPTWFEKVQGPTLSSVRQLYRMRDPQMWDVLERGITADRLATRVAGDDSDVSGLRKAFRGAGALIAANDGPRIAVLSVGGWDTHSEQGAAQGFMAELLTDLDQALSDFKTVVGSAWSKTVVVCATEFGRTVRSNGDQGTDHGVATTVLMCGGAVNGGKVFGDWPGIAANQLLDQSDLRPTTDVRSVFKGILRDHIGVARSLLDGPIFPDSGTGGAAPAPIMNNLVERTESASAALPAATPRAREEAPIARYRRGQKVSRARYMSGTPGAAG